MDNVRPLKDYGAESRALAAQIMDLVQADGCAGPVGCPDIEALRRDVRAEAKKRGIRVRTYLAGANGNLLYVMKPEEDLRRDHPITDADRRRTAAAMSQWLFNPGEPEQPEPEPAPPTDIRDRTGLTAEQRKQRAKIAANSRWARPFAREDQAAAISAAMEKRLRHQVDPDGALTDSEAAPLIAAAKRAHSARMHMAKLKKEQREG